MSIKIEGVQSYKDLCCEIDILTERLNNLESELQKLQKLMFVNAPKGASVTDYSTERVTSSRHVLPLSEIVPRLLEIQNWIAPLKEILNDKEQTKRKMEKTLNEYEGLDYRVATMRIKGMSLTEISDELGYSYGYIRKISMGLKKEHFRNKNLISQ